MAIPKILAGFTGQPGISKGSNVAFSVNRLIDTHVLNLKELPSSANVDQGTLYGVIGLISGTATGGGIFVYDASLSKSLNDGLVYFAPEAIAAWDGTVGNFDDLQNWTGSGTGVYVQINSNNAPAEWQKLPAIYKVLLTGIGSATIALRDIAGTVLDPYVYDVNGFKEEFPFFQDAYEFKITSTGTAKAEVV